MCVLGQHSVLYGFVSGPIVVILDSVNSIIYKVCPFLAAGLMVGSIYWVAVTYGAVTVMQVNLKKSK